LNMGEKAFSQERDKQHELEYAEGKIDSANSNTMDYLKQVRKKLTHTSVKTSEALFNMARFNASTRYPVKLAFMHVADETVKLRKDMQEANRRLQGVKDRYAFNRAALQRQLDINHAVFLITGDLGKQVDKVDRFLESLAGVLKGKAPTMVEFNVDFKASIRKSKVSVQTYMRQKRCIVICERRQWRTLNTRRSKNPNSRAWRKEWMTGCMIYLQTNPSWKPI